jgi:hypothetical protein
MTNHHIRGIQHRTVGQFAALFGRVKLGYKGFQTLPGKIEFRLAIGEVHVGFGQSAGDTITDSRSGAVRWVNVGGAMAADNIAGIDAVV